MVVSDGEPGLQVFVLRRVAAMEFASGMTVFPGGAVDPADREPVSWLGPDPQWWAEQLGVDANGARELVVAAVRELFEETGVLLANPATHSTDGPSAHDLEDCRAAILAHRRSLADVLTSHGLNLRADLLRPWANWITPPGRTRRYDTFFFAAALPPGQQARMLTTEADLGQWRTPSALFAERDAGVTALMPPTLAMLTDLARYGSVHQVLAAQRVVTPVRIGQGA